ncbi:zinc finger protein 800 [Elysia marginata]|uniref:Zinc finger protein 800 n=1 Tax=Elysia marginata TaxID=1093978 RepID=A0AAV4IBL0_9GAST|nr:zinc finger protein 800 [Elysia marginata]
MKQVNREKGGKPVDLSQLRQPIKLGGSILNQILNAVHYGSPELRALLQVECDFIFECKVCRSLFRDLANFISHKRVFCNKSVIEEQWLHLTAQLSDEEVVVLEPESPEETASQAPEDPTVASGDTEDLVSRQSVEQVGDDLATSSSSGEQAPICPVGADKQAGDNLATSSSSGKQAPICPVGADTQAGLSTEPQRQPSTSLPPAEQPPSCSDPSSVQEPSSPGQRQAQDLQCQQHQKNNSAVKGSGPRLSLEDTVQRLQARRTGEAESSSLQIYTQAAEKLERRKENTKVTTIKTAAIPTNSSAVFVDFSTRTRQRGGKDAQDETEEKLGVSYTENNSKSICSAEGENTTRRSEDSREQSRRTGSPSSGKEVRDGLQKHSKGLERKLSKRKKGDPCMCKKEKQRTRHEREQDEPRQLRKNEELSEHERNVELRKCKDHRETLCMPNGPTLRSKFVHNVPSELIRVGKPRIVYAEPQKILMDQLREMQDKVKQKAAAEGKTDVFDVSDDENDSATGDVTSFGILSQVESDENGKLSPTSKRNLNQKNGVYKCRMCTYEAVDKADCIRHIMRKHRYAMRHKSTLAIRSMAVYQSSSTKERCKPKPSPDESKSAAPLGEDTMQDEGMHDIVRKNLQFALEKAEEVVNSRQNTSQKQAEEGVNSRHNTSQKQAEEVVNSRQNRSQKQAEEVVNSRQNTSPMQAGTINSRAVQRKHVEYPETESHPLMCSKCNKAYSSKTTLNFHLKMAHSDTRTFYPCTLCKRVFATVQGVTRHLYSFHDKTGEKLSRIRGKIKKKAFTKPVSHSHIQQSFERASSQQIRKSTIDESHQTEHRPSKRPRLDSSNGELGVKMTAASELEVKKLSVDKSSKSNTKETNMKKGIQAMQSSSELCEAHAEARESPLNTWLSRNSLRSNSHKDGSTPPQPVTMSSSVRYNQSPQSNRSRDLSPRSLSKIVCKKCKRHFGRKISFDNHLAMCRGRRIITTPPKSERKPTATYAHKPVSPDVAQTSAKKESKHSVSKPQTSPKPFSLTPSSIGTRSRQRDSSSESQRSASSDTPAAVRRARVTRSLTPDRNSLNKRSSEAKTGNIEKELRRQIASYSNVDDVVRGRARRTVFSKYAKTTSNSDITDEDDSKSTLQIGRWSSKSGSIQVRKPRSVVKPKLSSSEDGPTDSPKADFSDTSEPSLTKAEFLGEDQPSESKGTDQSINLSREPSDCESKDVILRQKSALEMVAMLEGKTQDGTPSSHNQPKEERNGGSMSEAVKRKSSKVETASQADIISDIKPEMSSSASQNKKIDSQSHNDNSENAGKLYIARANRSNTSDINEEKKVIKSPCLLGSAEESMTKKPWKTPNIDAIDKLMDAIKHTAVKTKTNRGKPLDNTGLELSSAKPDSAAAKEENISEHPESEQPCSTKEVQVDTVKSRNHLFSFDKNQLLDERSQSFSKVSGSNSSGCKSQLTQENIPLKQETSVSISSTLAGNLPPSQSSNSCVESDGIDWKSARQDVSASSKFVDLNQEEAGCSVDSTSVEKKDTLSGTPAISSHNFKSASEKTYEAVSSDAASVKLETQTCAVPHETTTVCHPGNTAIRLSPKSQDEQQMQLPSIGESAPSTFSCSERNSNKSSSSTKRASVSGRDDNRLTNIDSNNILNKDSPLQLSTRAKSSKLLRETSLQDVHKGVAKPDLRSRIASKRIKKKHRALASTRFSIASGGKRKDSKVFSKTENSSSHQCQVSSKKSVRIVDIGERATGDIVDLENMNTPSVGKTGKKKVQDGSRIKTSANRAYVMRSSAGGEKLECFDKAKIFKFIDIAKSRCLACGVKYTKMYNLRRHVISNHLKWTRYRCSLCGCEKYDRAHLLRHIKEVHRDVLRERSAGPIQSLIINLTKQGSQARSVKISHTIKRNQETELKQNESIYARPTLSLRRRGRPTLPLLSPTSPCENILAETLVHSKKKSIPEPQKALSRQHDVFLSLPKFDTLKTRPNVSQSLNDLDVNSMRAEGNVETVKETATIAEPTAVTSAKRGILNVSSEGDTDDLDTAMSNGQDTEQSQENDNIFAQLQGDVTSLGDKVLSEVRDTSPRPIVRAPNPSCPVSSSSTRSAAPSKDDNACAAPFVKVYDVFVSPLVNKAVTVAPTAQRHDSPQGNHVSKCINSAASVSSQPTKCIASDQPEGRGSHSTTSISVSSRAVSDERHASPSDSTQNSPRSSP